MEPALALLLIVGVLSATQASSPTSLASYNVDINQSSVSGLSSGAYMSVQMQVAFSSTFVGAGVQGSSSLDTFLPPLPHTSSQGFLLVDPITAVKDP